MTNSHITISGSLKHDRFSPLKRASTHNADWGSSSPKGVGPNGHDLKGSSWPLGIKLKEGTRQALLREFGLKDKRSDTASTNCRSKTSLHLMQENASRMLALSSSSKSFLQQKVVEARKPASSVHKELCRSSMNLSSPNTGGLRRSCHLASIRPATVASLQPMKRSSIFRKAIKQQQS